MPKPIVDKSCVGTRLLKECHTAQAVLWHAYFIVRKCRYHEGDEHGVFIVHAGHIHMLQAGSHSPPRNLNHTPIHNECIVRQLVENTPLVINPSLSYSTYPNAYETANAEQYIAKWEHAWVLYDDRVGAYNAYRRAHAFGEAVRGGILSHTCVVHQYFEMLPNCVLKKIAIAQGVNANTSTVELRRSLAHRIALESTEGTDENDRNHRSQRVVYFHMKRALQTCSMMQLRLLLRRSQHVGQSSRKNACKVLLLEYLSRMRRHSVFDPDVSATIASFL